MRSRIRAAAADTAGLSEYEQLRQARIRENRAFLSGLGLEEAKQALRRHHPAKRSKQQPSAKRARRAPPSAPKVATRRSARSRGEAADDVMIDRVKPGGVPVLIGQPEALAKLEADAASGTFVVETSRYRQRMPEETLTLGSTGGTEQYGVNFLRTLLAAASLWTPLRLHARDQTNHEPKARACCDARAPLAEI